MLKVDVSKNLVMLNGDVIMDQDGKGNAIPSTVKMALVNAVLSPVRDEKGIIKVQKYELAQKIYRADKEVELTPEDVVLIKGRVEEVFAPLVVGQLMELLK